MINKTRVVSGFLFFAMAVWRQYSGLKPVCTEVFQQKDIGRKPLKITAFTLTAGDLHITAKTPM